MQIFDRPTDKNILSSMTPNCFGDMVKTVVDIERKEMDVDWEGFADIEEALLSLHG